MKLKNSFLIRTFLLFFALSFFINVSKAEAATARLTATADAWIDSLAPNTPHPAGDLQLTFDLLPSDQTTQLLVKFDTSSIPSGSTINSAIFTLYDRGCSGATDPYITAYRETSIWTEATATWSMDLRYTTAGQSNTNASQCLVESTVNFNVKDIVQAWANGSSNYGFRVIGETGDHSPEYTRTFYGREDASMYKPYLLVDYTAPVAGSTPPSGTTTNPTSTTGVTGTTGTGTIDSTGNISSDRSTSTGTADGINPDGTTATTSDDFSAVLSSDEKSEQPTSVLDALKHPSKIFHLVWWKIVLIVLGVLTVLGGLAALVIFLILKSRKQSAVKKTID